MFNTMRHLSKSKFFLVLGSALVLAQSCKKSDAVAEKVEEVSPQKIETLRTAIAASTGLPATQIQYNASSRSFSVDKDGMISLDDAQTRFPGDGTMQQGRNSESQQRVYPYILTRTNAANIAFYVDATVPAEWITALDQAIANWNGTNSLITMKRVSGTTTTTTTTTTTNTNPRKKKTTTTTTPTTTTSTSVPTYNVLVTTNYDNATSTIATAYYPDYYGNAGKQVTINTHYNTLSASYKLFAMTHELGHIIGFTHTDGTYGEVIPGTPVTDANSVMNSFVLPWNGFTPYDVTAVTTVYPR